MILTSIMLPGMTGVVTVVFYLAPNLRPWFVPRGESQGAAVFLGGLVYSLILWIVVSMLLHRLAYASRANTGTYSQLRDEFDGLKAKVEAYCSSGAYVSHPSCREALLHCASIEQDLGTPAGANVSYGLRWVLATAYTNVWERLHRIEEALLLIQPKDTLVGVALHDKLRIQNSAMEERDELIRHLGTATSVISPGASGLFPSTPVSKAAATEADARAMLWSVRRTVNDFRDARRMGLVQARNNLVKAVVLTGTTAFLLLGLALTQNAPDGAIVAAVTFYLVGAVVGLFKQLGITASVDTVKEPDYGLTTARLVHGPLYSGIAAVAGVALVALAGSFDLAGNDQATLDLPPLKTVFSLSENLLGLVWAAVFGLTPNLLTSRLERQAEKYKDELKSSDAGE